METFSFHPFFCFVYVPTFQLILKAHDPCLNLADLEREKIWKGVKIENFLIASVLRLIHFDYLCHFFIRLLLLHAPYSLVSFRYPALARTCTPMFFIRVVPALIMKVVAHAVPIKNRVMTAMKMHPPVRWFFSGRELRSSDTFRFPPSLNFTLIWSSYRATGFGLHLNMIPLVPGIPPQRLLKY